MFLGSRVRLVRKADNLAALCEPPFHNPIGLHGLLADSFRLRRVHLSSLLHVTGGRDIAGSDEILYLGCSASKSFHDWVNDRARPRMWESRAQKAEPRRESEISVQQQQQQYAVRVSAAAAASSPQGREAFVRRFTWLVCFEENCFALKSCRRL
jgi:hypothetical protein